MDLPPPFALRGQAFEVKIGCGLTDWHTRLVLDGRELARDHTHLLGAQVDYRNHHVTHTLLFALTSGISCSTMIEQDFG
ncbi:MAG: hypothetical protein EBR46_07450 [Betaproteobacteria bacterium]|nr:hypothetical protein [Betaproteobacteria bacterium]